MEYVELDIMIEFFINDHFTQYMGNQIKKSFTLFNNYGITDYEDYYLGLLPLQGINDPQETIANVMAELNNELDYILLVHGIELVDQTNIRIKNSLLEALLLYIDSLPDVKEQYYTTLSDEFSTDEEKLAYIIKDFTDINEYELLPIFQSVDHSLIVKMLNLINNEDDLLKSNPESIEVYKAFNSFVKTTFPKNQITLATSIVLSSFPLGLPINDYIPFIVTPLLKLDVNDILINLYSLYIISSNFLENDFINCYSQFEDFFKKNDRNDLPLSDLFLQLNNEFISYRSSYVDE